ncbi:MAG: peptidylprolyl isomerase [Candidatus Krumholzibacteriota bacterium]|nr:peptidylprolyl isomerase [Candidatus Krumholzibacteriota bacterium]
MLKQLRERTKVFLWIVVVAFVISIFAVWGMDLRTGDRTEADPEVAGIVNGERIPRQAYAQVATELLNGVKQQRGEDYRMSDMEYRMVQEQAWETTVQKYLIASEIEKTGITIGDDELVSFIRRNPHPSLQSVFVDDNGNFDYQAYLAALGDPSADWTQLENWARSILPEFKLESMLMAQVHVPDRELYDRFLRDSLVVKARYVRVPWADIDEGPAPTDAEIRARYDEIADEFVVPERRRIAVIGIEKAPSELDEEDVRGRLEEIRGEIMAGEDFAEAARNWSDDYMTAEKGGDLGFFSRGSMDSTFTETAFALEPGEVSEPVRTPFGYHLVKMEERDTVDGVEQVHVRHILMEVEPGYDTIDSLRTVLRDVIEEIKDRGFRETAEARGLQYDEPEPIARQAFIPGIGYNPRIINFAFNHRAGQISSTIESEDMVRFVKILEEIPEGRKPLDEVRETVAERILLDRRRAAARETAAEIRREAATSGDLESAALSRSFEMLETPRFRRDDAVPGIGANTAFATAAHTLAVGELSPPITGSDAYYLIVVTERDEPAAEIFADRRPLLLQQARTEMTRRFLANWYEKVRANAEVEDLREEIID